MYEYKLNMLYSRPKYFMVRFEKEYSHLAVNEIPCFYGKKSLSYFVLTLRLQMLILISWRSNIAFLVQMRTMLTFEVSSL